jgi:hypothetical protein
MHDQMHEHIFPCAGPFAAQLTKIAFPTSNTSVQMQHQFAIALCHGRFSDRISLVMTAHDRGSMQSKNPHIRKMRPRFPTSCWCVIRREVLYEYTCGCGDTSTEEGGGKPEPGTALDCGRILACAINMGGPWTVVCALVSNSVCGVG